MTSMRSRAGTHASLLAFQDHPVVVHDFALEAFSIVASDNRQELVPVRSFAEQRAGGADTGSQLCERGSKEPPAPLLDRFDVVEAAVLARDHSEPVRGGAGDHILPQRKPRPRVALLEG